MCSTINPLNLFLESLHPLPAALHKALAAHTRDRYVHKGGFLLEDGEEATELYFIHKGLIRSYTTTDTKERVLFFKTDGQSCLPSGSTLAPQKATTNLQAIEKTHVLSITFQSLDELCSQSCEMSHCLTRLLATELQFYTELLALMQCPGKLKRIESLARNFPELIPRVTSKMLASFLGISEVYFSNNRSYAYTCVAASTPVLLKTNETIYREHNFSRTPG